MLAQPELSLSAARLKWPTVKRDGARSILDVHDWQIEPLVQTGALRGVIDLRSPGAQRDDLRFVVVCLAEYVQAIRAGTRAPERSDEQIAELVFGKGERLVRAQRVYRALNCKHSHFYSLARAGVIPLARTSEPRTGPGGSAVVERTALVKFITDRRRA